MRSLSTLFIALVLTVTAASAQDRFYLVDGTSTREGIVSNAGGWTWTRTGPALSPRNSPVLADGGRYLVAVGPFDPTSAAWHVGRLDLRTGALSVLSQVSFDAGTVLVADPRSPRVLAVTASRVTVIDGDQVAGTIDLPAVGAGAGPLLVSIGRDRLAVARPRDFLNDELIIVNLPNQAVESVTAVTDIQTVILADDDRRLFVRRVAPGFVLGLDLYDVTTMTVSATRADLAPTSMVVDTARNVVAVPIGGSAFGGYGPTPPTGYRLLDATTLATVGTAAPGAFDGRSPQNAVRGSSRSPLLSMSCELFPGNAGGPRAPRIDIVNGMTGQFTGSIPISSCDQFEQRLLVMGPPAAPPALNATVSGSSIELSWSAPDHASQYLVEAGSAPGLRNLLLRPVGRAVRFTATQVPSGVYFVRVRAINEVGISDPSSELRIVVGQ